MIMLHVSYHMVINIPVEVSKYTNIADVKLSAFIDNKCM